MVASPGVQTLNTQNPPQSAASRQEPSRRRDPRPWYLLASVAVANVILLACSAAEYRPVLLPISLLIFVSSAFVSVLIARDGRVPVFELGSMFVLVVTIYGAIPLANYVAGGMEWGPGTDVRLWPYMTQPSEMATFGWRYVALLTAFVITYLLTRSRAPVLSEPLRDLDGITVAATLTSLILLVTYFWFMRTFFGLSYDESYATIGTNTGPSPTGRALPLIVLQVSHNLRMMLTFEKQLFVLILITHWRRISNRLLIFALLAVELILLLQKMYGRTEFAIVLLTTIVLYARFVRPLSLKLLFSALAVGLVAVLAYGALRQDALSISPHSEGKMTTEDNEFQAVFTTAYDLQKRRELGTLEVPWQIYVSDVYFLIPSQLLPFTKIDPADWYLQAVGLQGSNVGFMFGIMAQAAIGFGAAELIVRGILLGLLLGAIHRWYAKRQSKFWATAFYVFVLVWVYYSVRSTMLAWLYFICYAFLPVASIIATITLLLRRWHRRSQVSTQHARPLSRPANFTPRPAKL